LGTDAHAEEEACKKDKKWFHYFWELKDEELPLGLCHEIGYKGSKSKSVSAKNASEPYQKPVGRRLLSAFRLIMRGKSGFFCTFGKVTTS
jgi:hypothetical protein